MTAPVYELCIAGMLRSLQNLDAIVSKAEKMAAADEYLEPETLIQSRLYPNMAPLVFQIRVATDFAKGAAAPLSGNEVPSWADEEKSFEDLHERLAKGIDYLSSFNSEDFDGAQDRDIELELGPHTVNFRGSEYVSDFVLPNFFFHVTTAFNILRHNGLDVGKLDFLGSIAGLDL